MGGLRDALAIAAFYAAAFIGAGFASGREMAAFFVSNGRAGLWGIPAAITLLWLGSVAVLKRSQALDAETYSELFHRAAGRLGVFLDGAYSVFSLAGLAVMLAGSAEILKSFLGVPGGGAATALLVWLTIVRGQDWTLKTGMVLAPIMALSLFVPSLSYLHREGLALPQTGTVWGIPAAFLYASYNLCLSIGVWTAFQKRLRSRSEVILATGIGNAALGGLLVVVSLALWAAGDAAALMEMPVLAVTEVLGAAFQQFFAVILYLSMFSTALAHGYALTTRLTRQTTVRTEVAAGTVMCVGLVMAAYGFGTLVDFAYPLMGLMGLVMLGILLRSSSR